MVAGYNEGGSNAIGTNANPLNATIGSTLANSGNIILSVSTPNTAGVTIDGSTGVVTGTFTGGQLANGSILAGSLQTAAAVFLAQAPSYTLLNGAIPTASSSLVIETTNGIITSGSLSSSSTCSLNLLTAGNILIEA